MAMMAGKLYLALVAAGTSSSEAQAAAEELAVLNRDQIDLHGEFERIRGEFNLVKWMLGTMIALQLGTIGAIVSFAINHATFR